MNDHWFLHPLPLLGLALALWFAISFTYSYLRLRQFPGPRIASVSSLWIARANWSGQMHMFFKSANENYGPLVRIGPNDLITNDPELIKRMSAARSSYSKSDWYQAARLDPDVANMFSMRDGGVHDRLKAQTAFGYRGKENPGMEKAIDDQVQTLVDLIRTKSRITDGKHAGGLALVDLGRLVSFLTLDVITKIAFGQEFKYLETDSDVYGYCETLENTFPFLSLCAEIPSLRQIFTHPWVLALAGPKVTDKEGIGRIMRVAREVVGKRFGEKAEDHQDMMGSFVRHGVSQKQCEAEVTSQLTAGSDTAATAIRATMLFVMTTPHVLDRLTKEIDAAVQEGRVSGMVQSQEIPGLPYLEAVVLEGLRMHPPFAGLLMKEVGPEGDTYNGKFIPAGTRIGHNTWSVMRNAEIFGYDADMFLPERWINAEPTQRQKMVAAIDLVFGYGRWGCPGKMIAQLELKKTVFELVRRFEFQVANVTEPWTSSCYGMFLQKDMWVTVKERYVGEEV